MEKTPVLVVDDDEAIISTVCRFLEAKGYQVSGVQDGAEALDAVRTGGYGVVISDIYIDQVSGLDILREAKASNPHVAVVLMTAKGSVQTTVEAEAGGAFDYLAKPFELSDLLSAVERATTAAASVIREEPDSGLSVFGQMVGTSRAAVEVYKKIARYARSEETVLILGETGVGKELVARSIHEHSARARSPFVAVDSGTITGTLWESEVFGSLRGAFTGADRDRPGVIETARGGTVFFDEIAEVPPDFQGKLLRFLQDKEFRPVGAAAPRKADVRVIAATNRPLEQMVREGKFREDLYYRLNVLRIEVPPLRERRSDIPFLVRRFLDQACERSGKKVWLDAEALSVFERHPWPGNIRELQNAVFRLVALNPLGPVSSREVEQVVSGGLSAEPDLHESQSLDEMEQRQILRVLQETGGNKSKAAEILGIQRRTLYKKLERIKREAAGHTGENKTHP